MFSEARGVRHVIHLFKVCQYRLRTTVIVPGLGITLCPNNQSFREQNNLTVLPSVIETGTRIRTVVLQQGSRVPSGDFVRHDLAPRSAE